MRNNVFIENIVDFCSPGRNTVNSQNPGTKLYDFQTVNASKLCSSIFTLGSIMRSMDNMKIVLSYYESINRGVGERCIFKGFASNIR